MRYINPRLTLTLIDISPFRLSVCRLSVTFVRPTQPVKIFGNFSSPFGALAIHWHPRKILRRSSPYSCEYMEQFTCRHNRL